VVVEIPLAGRVDDHTFPVCIVRESQRASWERDFPAVDVVAALRHMRQHWLAEEPSRRKTRRHIGKSIATWLARARDRGDYPIRSSAPELAWRPPGRRIDATQESYWAANPDLAPEWWKNSREVGR